MYTRQSHIIYKAAPAGTAVGVAHVLSPQTPHQSHRCQRGVRRQSRHRAGCSGERTLLTGQASGDTESPTAASWRCGARQSAHSTHSRTKLHAQWRRMQDGDAHARNKSQDTVSNTSWHTLKPEPRIPQHHSCLRWVRKLYRDFAGPNLHPRCCCSAVMRFCDL